MPMHSSSPTLSRKIASRKIGIAALAPLAVAALLWPAQPSRAAVLSQSERLTYQVMLGGLHVGDVLVVLNQTEAGYSTEMKMVARGVAQMMQNFRADIRGEGAFVRRPAGDIEMIPQPAAFHRAWQSDEFAATMTMSYDPLTRTATSQERMFNPVTGATMKREDMPWGKGNQPKAVPADMRADALDPMAAFVAARQQIMAQRNSITGVKSFRVPTYDGSRRYDVVGKTGAVRSTTVNGTSYNVVPVTAGIEPVFGFQRKSEDRMRGSEGKLLFTADARFIPVQLVVGNEMFSAVMNISADCSIDPRPCDTFGQVTE